MITKGNANVDDSTLQLEVPINQNLPKQLIQPQMTRSTKEHYNFKIYPPNEYVMLTKGGQLKSYLEVMSNEHKEKWLQALQDELNSSQ